MSEQDDLSHEIDELAAVEEHQKREYRVLVGLLDKLGAQKDKHFAVRGYMGSTNVSSGSPTSISSFSSMHTLDWIGKNILMGSEMDFMSKAIDEETGRLVIDEESAETLKQRAPDWTRQADLATYLLQDRNHKFGTILAVLSPSWVDDPNHEFWGSDGRAVRNAMHYESLDSTGELVLLDLSDVKAYALDGQHRVMGIRGVQEVLGGALVIRSKDGAEKKRMPKDELLKRLDVDVSAIRQVLDEKINVEYIPAVVAGETREEASRRIRSVFVAINNYAKKVTGGENILLSENDGSSIVARRIAHTPIFRNLDGSSRVNWKDKNLSASDDQHVMTLAVLQEATEEARKRLHPKFVWDPLFKTVPVRPHEDELAELEKELQEILEKARELPIFRRIDQGDSIKELRDFPEDSSATDGGHLLLRPIGIKMLIAAIADCLAEGTQDLDRLFRKVEQFDRDGGFAAHLPSSLWYSVTFNPLKRSMIATGGSQTIAIKAMSYMLQSAGEEDRDRLAHDLKMARRLDDERWVNFEGKSVPLADVLYLPAPIKI